MGNLEPGFMNKNPASGRWSVTGRIVQRERAEEWIGVVVAIIITPAAVITGIVKALTIYQVLC